MSSRRWPTTRAAGEHPVRRDDHVRPRRSLDRLRILDVVGDDLVGVVERRVAAAQERSRLLVEVVGVLPVDVGRLGRHRRVEVERQERDRALLDEPVELPHDLLRPPDRERRDQQHAVRLVDQAHGLGEDAHGLVRRLVLATAVRGLDEDVVGGVEDRRVADDRRPGPAEVAGHDDHPLRPVPILLRRGGG